MLNQDGGGVNQDGGGVNKDGVKGSIKGSHKTVKSREDCGKPSCPTSDRNPDKKEKGGV